MFTALPSLNLTSTCGYKQKDEGHNSSLTGKERICVVGVNRWKLDGVGGKDPGGVGVDSSIWNRVGCAPEDANTSKGFKTFARLVKPCDSEGVNPPTTRKQLLLFTGEDKKSGTELRSMFLNCVNEPKPWPRKQESEPKSKALSKGFVSELGTLRRQDLLFAVKNEG
ncbi:hypothetical protein Bca4012_098266 [Brassica carinata]